MRVVAKRTINAYRECYPDADEKLRSWVSLIEEHDFEHLAALKDIFNRVDHIKGDIVVFKRIKGNKYRLICGMDYRRQRVFVKWFGPHKEYDKINPLEVKHVYPPC